MANDMRRGPPMQLAFFVRAGEAPALGTKPFAWLNLSGIQSVLCPERDDLLLEWVWRTSSTPAPTSPDPASLGDQRQVGSTFIERSRLAIEDAAQRILDARAKFPDSTLADLYDPLTMPLALVKAHHALDRAVDAAYLAAEMKASHRIPKLNTDAERVAFLFERYQAMASLLKPSGRKPSRRRPLDGSVVVLRPAG